MAAQTFTAPCFYSGPVQLTNFPGVIERSRTLDLDLLIGPDGTDATPLEANDVIKIFKLPVNAKILYGVIESEALDGHATPTLDVDLQVTDGTTTKLLFDGATIVQGGGRADTRDAGATGEMHAFSSNSAVGYVLDNADYYLALKCMNAPATFQNDQIRVSVGYTMAVENEELDRDIPSQNPA